MDDYIWSGNSWLVCTESWSQSDKLSLELLSELGFSSNTNAWYIEFTSGRINKNSNEYLLKFAFMLFLSYKAIWITLNVNSAKIINLTCLNLMESHLRRVKAVVQLNQVHINPHVLRMRCHSIPCLCESSKIMIFTVCCKPTS